MEHGRVSGEGLILGESTVPLQRRRRSGLIDKKKEEEGRVAPHPQ